MNTGNKYILSKDKGFKLVTHKFCEFIERILSGDAYKFEKTGDITAEKEVLNLSVAASLDKLQADSINKFREDQKKFDSTPENPYQFQALLAAHYLESIESKHELLEEQKEQKEAPDCKRALERFDKLYCAINTLQRDENRTEPIPKPLLITQSLIICYSKAKFCCITVINYWWRMNARNHNSLLPKEIKNEVIGITLLADFNCDIDDKISLDEEGVNKVQAFPLQLQAN